MLQFTIKKDTIHIINKFGVVKEKCIFFPKLQKCNFRFNQLFFLKINTPNQSNLSNFIHNPKMKYTASELRLIFFRVVIPRDSLIIFFTKEIKNYFCYKSVNFRAKTSTFAHFNDFFIYYKKLLWIFPQKIYCFQVI